VVFATEWFTIERELFDDVRNLDGKPLYRFKTSDSVMVLAMTPTTEIVLVKQFRPSDMQHTLQLPADYIDAAKRLRRPVRRTV
jgi:hypothetical protein